MANPPNVTGGVQAIVHGNKGSGDAPWVPVSTDASGNVNVNVVSGGGTGGTSSTFGAAFPATGTAVGAKDSAGTNMAALNLDSSGNLKVNVAAGGSGGGAVTIADGADVAEGATTDAAVTGDNAGTVKAALRGLGKIFSDVWDSTNHWLKVSLQASSAVIGHVITDSGSTTAATQATASNLNATVVGTGTFATQATLQTGSAQIGHLEANQSTNVSQINGVTPLMGAGNTGTGSPRVTIASDQAAIPVSESGTWTVQPGNTANTTPWLVTAGHGKTIKSLSGSFTSDTDIVAAVTSKRIKVIGYAFFTFGTSATTLLLKSNGTGGTLLWTVSLQSVSAQVMGANLAVSAPSWIFATAAGEKLTADTNTSDTVYWSISYFDDDAS